MPRGRLTAVQAAMMLRMNELAHGRITPLTRSHLAALALTTVSIAVLAFFVGLEVGRSGRPQPALVQTPLVPDVKQQDDLEALLHEVQAARNPKQGQSGELTFLHDLPANRTAPVPPPSAQPTSTPATVAPAPGAPIPHAPKDLAAGQVPTSGWAVQVGKYGSRSDADAQVDALNQRGFRAYRIATLVHGRTVWSVRVGGFTTRTRAEEARAELSEIVGDTTSVVEAP